PSRWPRSDRTGARRPRRTTGTDSETPPACAYTACRRSDRSVGDSRYTRGSLIGLRDASPRPGEALDQLIQARDFDLLLHQSEALGEELQGANLLDKANAMHRVELPVATRDVLLQDIELRDRGRRVGIELGHLFQRAVVAIEGAHIDKGDPREFLEHALRGDLELGQLPVLLLPDGRRDLNIPQQALALATRRLRAVAGADRGLRGVLIDEVFGDEPGLLRSQGHRHLPA